MFMMAITYASDFFSLPKKVFSCSLFKSPVLRLGVLLRYSKASQRNPADPTAPS